MNNTIHMVFPKGFISKITAAMEALGYAVHDTDESIEMFSYWATAEANKNIHLDAVIIGDPAQNYTDDEESLKEYFMYVHRIREARPNLRLILLLPARYAALHQYTMKFTQMNIYDIYYENNFQPVLIKEWIENPKSFSDWNDLIINQGFPATLPIAPPKQESAPKKPVQKAVQQEKIPPFAEQKQAPVQETAIKQAKPQAKEPVKPVQQKPAQEAPVPPIQQQAPVQEVPALPVQQQAPVQEVPAPPVQQQAPVQEVPAPPVQQQTPIQEEPTPQPKKEKPMHRLFDSIAGGKKEKSQTETVETVESFRLPPERFIEPKQKELSDPAAKTQAVPKMIAFVNISRSAGSTFHSVNFARWLSLKGYSAALYEDPTHYEGRTYAAEFIGLETTGEKAMQSLPHMICRKTPVDLSVFTKKGELDWYVTDPNKGKIPDFNSSQFLRYGHTGKQTFKIFDLGSLPIKMGHSPLLQEILPMFDHVVCLVDMMPHAFMANIDTLEYYMAQKNELNRYAPGTGDDKFRFVINKYNPAIPKKELKLIQLHDAHKFPPVEMQFVYEALYSGKLPVDHDKVAEQLEAHYMELADDLELGIREEGKGRKFNLFRNTKSSTV